MDRPAATGTQVATSIDASGHLTTKNIDDVQVGDLVLTRNQNDPADPLEQRQVTAVEVHTVTSLRLLDIQEAENNSKGPGFVSNDLRSRTGPGG